MSNFFHHLAMALGLSTGLGSALLVAQSKRTIAEVPFDFIAANRVMPAGSYAIGEANATGAVEIRSLDRTDRALVLSHWQKPGDSGNPRLVFRRYGDHYFLAEAWLSGDPYGHTFMKSHIEEKLIASKSTAVIAAIQLK